VQGKFLNPLKIQSLFRLSVTFADNILVETKLKFNVKEKVDAKKFIEL